MKRATRQAAQDRIMAAVVHAALQADEAGEPDVADAIRAQGAALARRFGLCRIPGLPATFTGS